MSAIIDKLYANTNGRSYSYSELFDIVNERNKQMEYSNILSASQEYGMIERSDLNLDIKFELGNIVGYKIVRKGDYVVHLRSFQGGLAFSKLNGVCSPAYTILRPNNLVVEGFLSHFFTSKLFINSLRLVTYGIRDGRSINVDEMLEMKITIPSLTEQKKIIDVIASIDNKLFNEEKITATLVTQKLYLLQQMFI